MANLEQGSFNISDAITSGTLTALNQTVSLNTEGAATVAFKITGTFSATISFEASVDNTNWDPITAQNFSTGLFALSTTGTGTFLCHASGFLYFRVKCTSFTSGTATVSLTATNDGARFQETQLRDTNGLAITLGQKTKANSLPVALASDTDRLNTVLNDSSGNELQSFDLDNTGGVAKVLGVSIRTLSNGAPAEFGTLANPFNVVGSGTGFSNPAIGTNNTTLPGSSILIGGNDGTNIRPLSVLITNPATSAVGLVVRPIPYRPKTFSALSSNTTIGNNKSMLSIQNATGSGVTIRIISISIINVQTTAVTGVIAEFNLFRFATHSAGTLITASPYDTTRTLNGSVTCRTGATIASEATNPMMRWLWSSDEWGTGTLDVESSDHGLQSLAAAWTCNPAISDGIVLNPNEGIHVKQTTNSTKGTFDVLIEFIEE